MNPWLSIPLDDYEGHMAAVGQTAALRELFRRIYLRVKPRRLAVLGCTSGGDFDIVEPALTAVAVGVDVNAAYIQAGQQRSIDAARAVEWVCGDVLTVDLPQAPFDLVHAALLFEYVDAERLFLRVRHWLRPGGLLSVVTQQPATDQPAVSSTRFESLRKLSSTMRLRGGDEIRSIAAAGGFVDVESNVVQVANGKVLAHSVYRLEAPAQVGTEG